MNAILERLTVMEERLRRQETHITRKKELMMENPCNNPREEQLISQFGTMKKTAIVLEAAGFKIKKTGQGSRNDHWI